MDIQQRNHTRRSPLPIAKVDTGDNLSEDDRDKLTRILSFTPDMLDFVTKESNAGNNEAVFLLDTMRKA